MSFDSRIIAFAERFLSHRTFQLIVEPAVADLQFEHGSNRIAPVANRLAVLRAVAGGIREDVARNSAIFLALALIPACYYIVLLIMFLDFFTTTPGFLWADFFVVASVVAILSLGPVAACFWPETTPPRTVRAAGTPERRTRPVD